MRHVPCPTSEERTGLSPAVHCIELVFHATAPEGHPEGGPTVPRPQCQTVTSLNMVPLEEQRQAEELGSSPWLSSWSA